MRFRATPSTACPRFAWASTIASLGLLAGCTGPEPGTPIEFPREPVRVERRARDPEPTTDVLAPVDRWREQLASVAPAGWIVEDPVDQLESPDGWERLAGGRGISFTLVNKGRTIAVAPGVTANPRFAVLLFPRGWEGRDLAAGVAVREDRLWRLPRPRPELATTDDPARFFGANGEWLYFHATKGHDGWDRAPEDVARALGVTAPRG